MRFIQLPGDSPPLYVSKSSFSQSDSDMIMESTKDWKHEPEPEELVAEDATLKNIWKQEEYISLGRSLIIQDTLTIIQATPPSS